MCLCTCTVYLFMGMCVTFDFLDYFELFSNYLEIFWKWKYTMIDSVFFKFEIYGEQILVCKFIYFKKLDFIYYEFLKSKYSLLESKLC